MKSALKRPKLSAQPAFLEGLFLTNIIIICKAAKFKEKSKVGFKMSHIFGTTAFLGGLFLTNLSLSLSVSEKTEVGFKMSQIFHTTALLGFTFKCGDRKSGMKNATDCVDLHRLA